MAYFQISIGNTSMAELGAAYKKICQEVFYLQKNFLRRKFFSVSKIVSIKKCFLSIIV